MLLLMLALRLGLAQVAAAPDTAVPPKGSIDGRVLDAANGHPIRKATVTLQTVGPATGVTDRPASSSYVTVTGAEGRFHFDAVDRGTYRIRLDRAGYTDLERREGIELEAGEKVSDIELRLTPQAVLAGHVLDEDGDPVVSASITAIRWSQFLGRKRMLEMQGAAVDADGYFLFAGLAPGHYYLVATDDQSAGRSEESAVPTFYPGAIDADGAVSLDLQPGSERRNLEIRLRKARVYRVRGRVIDAAGKPVAYAELLLLPGRPDEFRSTSRSARVTDGNFEFSGVLPASYVILSSPNAYRPDKQTSDFHKIKWSCHERITVAERNLEDLVVPLGPGLTITGSVLPAEGDGASRTTALAKGIALIPVEGPFPPVQFEIDGDGSFHASDIQQGRYRLDVVAAEDLYLKRIRYAGEERTDPVLDLTSNSGGTLEICLAKGASELRLNLRAGTEELPDPVFAVWSRDGRISRVVPAGPKGGAVLSNLAPGEYRVLAIAGESALPVDDDTPWNDLEKVATAVTLAEGAAAGIELELLTVEEIERRIMQAR